MAVAAEKLKNKYTSRQWVWETSAKASTECGDREPWGERKALHRADRSTERELSEALQQLNQSEWRPILQFLEGDHCSQFSADETTHSRVQP